MEEPTYLFSVDLSFDATEETLSPPVSVCADIVGVGGIRATLGTEHPPEPPMDTDTATVTWMPDLDTEV